MTRLPKNRPPTHPGEMLNEEYIKPLGVTQTALAQRLGVSHPRLNDLIHARRGMTPDTALRLERVLGASASTWMQLQQDHDMWYARRAPEMKAIHALEPLEGVSSK